MPARIRAKSERERIRGRRTSSSTLSAVSVRVALFLLPRTLAPRVALHPSEKRKRRRMLNDPSTSGQPSATLLSSCISALYGLADRVATGCCSAVDANLVEDGCPPLSRPFRLGTLKYYTGRIAALLVALVASLPAQSTNVGLLTINDIALVVVRNVHGHTFATITGSERTIVATRNSSTKKRPSRNQTKSQLRR